MATVSLREQLLEENRKLREEIERKTGKTPEQLYEEREKRITDAIQLREPDRVPVMVGAGYFAVGYAGLPPSTVYYDPVAFRKAQKKAILDFEPDMYWPGTFGSGPTLELLDPKHILWPGGNLSPDIGHQAIEQEYMKEDEYDLFLSDPADYTMRYLLPRAFGALAPLAKLPSITDRFTQFPSLTAVLATPEFQKMAQTVLKAGQQTQKLNEAMAGFDEEMASLGFPPHRHIPVGSGAGSAPFDAISDYYRGMRGAMTDMYRCPDKLLAACDKILEMRIRKATPADPKKRGNPKRSGAALHRGAEGFMSRKQYETFYWPGLKKAMLADISLGYAPIPFAEGRFGSRLEYFLELPKGKAAVYFDMTDMVRAKEILRDHVCIMGNVPLILLQVGSTQEVEEYCERLIKICGKGGGFILTSGAYSADKAKPANLKAMVDSAKKYSAH